jgi:ATP-binding protein involved in chromosome partitioning
LEDKDFGDGSRHTRECADRLSRVDRSGQRAERVEANLIQGLVLREGHVGFSVEVPAARGPRPNRLRKAAEDAVAALPGVLSVTAVLTAHQDSPEVRAQSPGISRNRTRASAPHAPPQPMGIPGVTGHRGGERQGRRRQIDGRGQSRAGTFQARIQNRIARCRHLRPLRAAPARHHEKPRSRDGKKLEPIEKFGLKTMSIGFLIKEDEPMIWRGPMVMSALTQMLADVAWAPLDVLVVDMPPGTGDAQLTMAQRVPLKGAVIVSTPQDLALIDARKGLAMFRKTQVPDSGHRGEHERVRLPPLRQESHIFGHGGARATAEELNVPFLGEIPLVPAIRETSDAGTPYCGACAR